MRGFRVDLLMVGFVGWMRGMDRGRLMVDGGWWMVDGWIDGMDSVSEFVWRWWLRVLSAEWTSDGGARTTGQPESSTREMALGQETLGHWDTGGKRRWGQERHCSVSWTALQQVSGVSRSRSVLGWRHTPQRLARRGLAGPSSHRGLAHSGQGRQGTRKGERRGGRLYGTRPAG